MGECDDEDMMRRNLSHPRPRSSPKSASEEQVRQPETSDAASRGRGGPKRAQRASPPDLKVSRASEERVPRLLNDGDPPFAHRVAKGVARQVLSNVIALGDAHVLVDDGAADVRATADVDVVEQNRRLDARSGVDEDVPTQHRVL